MTMRSNALPRDYRLPSGVKQDDPLKNNAQGQIVTARYVVERLEAAGAALLAMPAQGYSPQLRQSKYDIVHAAVDAYGWQPVTVRAAMPDAREISRMDEAFGWLSVIPEGKYLLRRIVGARALVHPITRRYLFPWRRLGSVLGADHKSIQRWHKQGVDLIVLGLA